MYLKFGKRMVDLIIALPLLFLLAPLLVLAAIAIKLESPGPVLFRQTRVGRNEAPYTIYKLRSMPFGTPNVESKQASHLTITRFGKFIRRTNIDELPQIFNVIGGTMSLVGPRPSLPTQQNLIELRRKNGVTHLLPGITGLAQMEAVEGFTDEQKVRCDAQYAKQVSFVGDVLIMCRTLGYLRRKPPVY
jgi:O-antigen biosynthesis protein WbqP